MDYSNISGYDDLTVDFRIMWDDDNLYYFIQVWDDTLIQDSDEGTRFADDSIDLYWDPDDSKQESYDGVNDLQINFVYDETNVLKSPVVVTLAAGTLNDKDLSAIEQAGKITEKGFNAEIKVPFATLDLPATEGYVFGFELDYNDDDDGGDRDTKCKTGGQVDETWQNPSYMTCAILAKTYPVVPVSVEDNTNTTTPSDFALQQNYPNPFNPVTMISYQIPMTSDVELSIFNQLGQKVATLVSGVQSAGVHTVDFDASNLTTGVYFYRIDVQSSDGTKYSKARKMVLMK
jgi:hypothetical protein